MSVEIQSNTESFKERHRQAVVKTLDDIGTNAESNLRDRLAVLYPPSSVRGESPHKRTGLLQAGVAHQTEEEDGVITMTVTSNRAGGNPKVPIYLEGKMDRPYMQPEKDAWEEVIPDELRDGIQGNLSV